MVRGPYTPKAAKRFADFMAGELGVVERPQRSKKPAKSPPEWEEYYQSLESTPWACLSRGQVLGCQQTRCRLLHTMEYKAIRSLGIPSYILSNSPVTIPLCPNCSLLYMWKKFSYRTKYSWEQAVVSWERMALPGVMKRIDGEVEKFLTLIHTNYSEAEEYLDELRAQVIEVEFQDTKLFPVDRIPNNHLFVYLDFSQASVGVYKLLFYPQ